MNRHLSLQSLNAGNYLTQATRCAAIAPLLGMLLLLASCGGPIPTYVTLIDEMEVDLISGVDYMSYPAAPTLPVEHIERVAVLHAEPGGDDGSGRIHPKYLQVAIRSVSVAPLDPSKCSAEVTELQEKLALVKITLQSQTGCVIQYTAELSDPEQYKAAVPLCWSYKIGSYPNSTFVLTGTAQPCP